MTPLRNIWRQLVQRRLWPIAIVLVAGLAAVPMLLAKEPVPVAATPPAPVATGDNALAEEPIVAPATPTGKRRDVLGKRKNPFAMPEKDDPAKTTDKPSAGVVRTTSGGAGKGSSGSDGGGGSTAEPAPASPAPAPAPAPAPVDAAPKPKPKAYAPQELTVRFGTSDDLSRRSLKRLQPLPSAEQPVLIYMGARDDGKTAEFLVDHDVVPDGDGRCLPSPEDCETIRLRAGETEFLDVKDAAGAVTEQYRLDLLEIHRGSAAKARAGTRARAARALRSSVGRTSAGLG